MARFAGVILIVTFAAQSISAAAGPQENSDCLKCHSSTGLKTEREGRDISLYVDAEQYALSVHANLSCTSCHEQLEGVEEYPHAKNIDRVDCMACHDDDEEAVAVYLESIHGQRLDEGHELAPVCQDCHGDHYILPLTHPDSAIAPLNIPRMCAQCHAEGAPVDRVYDIPQEHILQRYTQSIHGEGLFRQGLVVTAVCTSCHTGHNVLPSSNPKSSTSRDHISDTCMKCHGLIESVHRKIIKGELWEKEKHKVPVCVECHSPHEARRVQYDTGLANADCLFCHAKQDLVAKSDGRSVYVDREEYEASVHGRDVVACAQCHTGVDPANKERPCETIAERVDCAICHEVVVVSYSEGVHGQLHARGEPNAPYCTDCHGRHNMLEHEIEDDTPEILKDVIRESPTYSRNVPALCARCHREGAAAARRYLGPETEIIKHYTMSIHGKGLLESGLTVTAICTSCHTAHKELPANNPESTVHEDNIAATCGRCHDGIYEQYEASIHSPTGNPDYVQLRDMPKLPRCSECHSSHTVERTDVPDFKLGIIRECGQCHKDVTETYFQTFHGKASELGDAAKAKCYDCHGAHDILPVDNPASRLHRDNIVATCGACHPGSHRQFAGYLTHATHHDPDKYPALFYAFWGMTTLLVGTFGFFFVHTLAWFPRSLKWRREIKRAVAAGQVKVDKHVVRFTSYQRKLHIMIIVSFFGLAITGMMLKFAYTPWAQLLARVLGGTETAGFIHRVCAIITFGYFGLHLWDLYQRFRRGKQPLKSFLWGPDTMLPKWSDFREFGQTVKWFVGKGPRPRYGRWTYWEKFDYFAVFWGVAIIGSTGLCLWFPEFFTRFLPGWSINVATIIHSDEALLATGFIFTIHFFNSHFRPEKFPMDDVIFVGTVPLEELKHDRPRWYEELVERGELEKITVEKPHTPRFEQAVKILGFSALTIGVVLIVLIIYAMLFAYR